MVSVAVMPMPAALMPVAAQIPLEGSTMEEQMENAAKHPVLGSKLTRDQIRSVTFLDTLESPGGSGSNNTGSDSSDNGNSGKGGSSSAASSP